MKLASFRHGGQRGFGVLVEGGIAAIGGRFSEYEDLRSFLAKGGLDDPIVAKWAAGAKADFRLEDIDFLPVIPNPDKIVCIGANYRDHLEETKLGSTEHPIVFFRLANSQIGHLDPILLPPESDKLDFEGEIAVIIGKEGRRIKEEEAYRHVAGYACYNDASIRDWQMHTPQWGPGKNFNGTGAFGPWMVTGDEIDPAKKPLKLETRLNGEVVQRTDTDLMIFPIPKLVAYISTFTTLYPGDVIVTGTPGGVGVMREPKRFMKPGDRVEVEVDQIGTLVNEVKAEMA